MEMVETLMECDATGKSSASLNALAALALAAVQSATDWRAVAKG